MNIQAIIESVRLLVLLTFFTLIYEHRWKLSLAPLLLQLDQSDRSVKAVLGSISFYDSLVHFDIKLAPFC